MNDNFILYMTHMDVNEQNCITFIGAFPNDNPNNKQLFSELDGETLEIQISKRCGIEIRRKYVRFNANISTEFVGKIKLPEGISDKQHFEIYEVEQGKKRTVFALEKGELIKYIQSLSGSVDSVTDNSNEIKIVGWVASSENTEFIVLKNAEVVACDVNRKYRKDVLEFFPEVDKEALLGFEIIVHGNYKREDLDLLIVDGALSLKKSLKEDEESKIKKKNLLQKAYSYYRFHGIKKTGKKIIKKLLGQTGMSSNGSKMAYKQYWEKYAPTEMELDVQRSTVFEYNPKFSIVIPLYNTPKPFLKELIKSVMYQTYPHWQLCLADGSETNELEAYVKEYSNYDSRVCYKFLGYNRGISDNTNGAMEMAIGDFIAFSDHDDLLTLDAFFECAKALNEDRDIDCLYTDEDKIDMDGKTLFMPHFKPDFNIDLLCSHNYITHLFVVRKSVVDEVGGLRREYDGSQDHDMIFRCVEKARKVYHIPKILYHWRCHMNSTAMNPESKLYCYESGRKAVQAHWDRIGIPTKVELAQDYGYYVTNYLWKDNPKVSIIIPNMNHKDDLKICVESILEKSTYRNFEIIIVENNSKEESIFQYYSELEQKTNVRVVRYEGDFNYSKINNFGVEQCDGDYILFLNNDTELIREDSIKQMIDICRRSDVGAVGARLYYADNTIQHAGVILGVGGVANHAFCGLDRGEVGYFFRSICTQDLSAVTAACLMTSRKDFLSVNGLSEDLAVAFNDVDYCLKLREKDKLVVYTPYSEWYHYESRSRGYENTPDKLNRLQKESDIFMKRWGPLIENGDPYYNPNFNRNRADFTIKE